MEGKGVERDALILDTYTILLRQLVDLLNFTKQREIFTKLLFGDRMDRVIQVAHVNIARPTRLYGHRQGRSQAA